jgi:hypothetical protein
VSPSENKVWLKPAQVQKKHGLEIVWSSVAHSFQIGECQDGNISSRLVANEILKYKTNRAYPSLWVSTVASGEFYSSEVYAKNAEMEDNFFWSLDRLRNCGRSVRCEWIVYRDDVTNPHVYDIHSQLLLVKGQSRIFSGEEDIPDLNDTGFFFSSVDFRLEMLKTRLAWGHMLNISVVVTYSKIFVK